MPSLDLLENVGDGFQQRQSAVDEYLHHAKCWNHWMTIHRRTYAEDYGRGHRSYFYDLKFLFPSIPKDQGRRMKFEVRGRNLVHFARLVLSPKAGHAGNLKLWNQEPVFIANVQPVQIVEGVSVPSFVRLYDVEQGVCNIDDGLLVWSLFDKLFKSLPRLVERKLDVFSFSGISESDAVPNVIERSFEVMDGVPENEANFFGKLFVQKDFEHLVSSLSVTLAGDEAYTFGLAEGPNQSLQVQDVMFGPFDFRRASRGSMGRQLSYDNDRT